MNKLFSYFKQSAYELKLVTWPTQERLLQLTVITVIFVLISALFLGLMDYGFSTAYTWLLSLNA
jgi:preprotein translocase subunit SecE